MSAACFRVEQTHGDWPILITRYEGKPGFLPQPSPRGRIRQELWTVCEELFGPHSLHWHIAFSSDQNESVRIRVKTMDQVLLLRLRLEA